VFSVGKGIVGRGQGVLLGRGNLASFRQWARQLLEKGLAGVREGVRERGAWRGTRVRKKKECLESAGGREC